MYSIVIFSVAVFLCFVAHDVILGLACSYAVERSNQTVSLLVFFYRSGLSSSKFGMDQLAIKITCQIDPTAHICRRTVKSRGVLGLLVDSVGGHTSLPTCQF